MYGYIDYFNPREWGAPYQKGEEALRDYFLMLDMFLDGYIRHKEFLSGKNSFHVQGLLPTEEQLRSYLEEAPAVRFTDLPATALKEDVMRAFSQIRSREDASDEAAMYIRRMAKEFSLSWQELLVILIAASVERDLKYVRIYQRIAGDSSLFRPTTGIIDALLRVLELLPDDYVASLLAPEGKLRTWFIEVFQSTEKDSPGQGEDVPFLRRSIRLGESVWRYMQAGEQGCRLKPYDDRAGLCAFFEDFADAVAVCGEGVHVCYVEAQAPEDVVHALLALAAKTGQQLVVLAPESLAGHAVSDITREILFEIRMCHRLVLFQTGSFEREEQKKLRARKACAYIMKLLARHMESGTFFFSGETKMPQLEIGEMLAPAVCILPFPDVRKRIRLWEHFLNVEKVVLAEDVNLEDIADCHELSASSIRRVLREVHETMFQRKQEVLGRPLLQELIFGLSSSDFDNLATPIEARYHWEDIFLEPASKKRLKAACDRYRLRNRVGDAWGINQKNVYGNAVIVLMYGAPGTGKTMAAQAIANEVMTPLYRVDVSQIFSKYIGETQKNLSKIFDEARKRNVVLFFDEADALFTKRTEVKDSHDKYTNSDTSFLLQKVEEYNGISILATNSFQSFDPAFMRRLTYVVHFERPSQEVRYQMWKTMLPEQVPMDPDVDFEWLAESFEELSGSNIKSILLTAAYFAGAEARSVRMQDIILAARYEFEKLGRLINSEEFGRYAIYIQEG